MFGVSKKYVDELQYLHECLYGWALWIWKFKLKAFYLRLFNLDDVGDEILMGLVGVISAVDLTFIAGECEILIKVRLNLLRM